MTPPTAAIILHIEDDLANRQSMARMLEAEGFCVWQEATGAGGLSRAVSGPDLVLLDVQLPDMSGFDVCRRLRADPRTASIPILQLSGQFVRFEHRVHGLEGGADGYLTKTVAPEELIAHINALLRVRRAEQNVRKANVEWQATFDAVRDGICSLDLQDRVVRCNTDFAQLFGETPEALVGRDYAELRRRGTATEVSAMMEGSPAVRMTDSVEQTLGERVATEIRLGQRWFRETWDPIRDPSGSLVGRVVIWSEMTQRKQLEEALRTERDFNSAILETIDALVIVLDSEGRFLRFNRTCTDLSGHTLQEVQGRYFWETLIAAEEATVVRNHFGRLLRGESPLRFEATWVRKDGGRRSIEWSHSRLVDDHDEFRYAIGTGIDVTQQRSAEWTIRRLAQIVETTDDAIIGISLDGIVSSWNPGAARMFGYDADEILGRPIGRIVPPDRADEEYGILRRVQQGKPVQHFETVRIRKDEREIHVALTVSPIRDEQGTPLGASIIARDISQRRVLEDQLRQAQKMEAVGHLAGGVAHDFNNLLTIISGYSELLVNTLPREDPSHALIVEVRKAGNRAAALTRQLLAFSRRQILQPTLMDLNEVVADLEKMLTRLIGEDIDLITYLEPRLDRIRADAGQVEQVIMNLVVNARDAMPTGGKLTIETRNADLDETYVQTHAEVTPGPYVLLAVSDTGVGMTPDVKSHIFEPFFTTKGPGAGTGLGLATVYGIVKQSKGHVEAYSEPGRGSTFKVYLPRAPLISRERRPESGEFHIIRGSETILVAEDEDGVRTLARLVLEAHGYTVLEARNGEEAVQLATQHQGPLDLLLTDVVMPQMGGRQLADLLHPLFPRLRTLFVSGYTNEAIVRHGVLEAGVAFLQKPFTPASLARKIRELLDAAPRPGPTL